MGNRTNYGTGRMTVDNRQKNERSRSGNPYSSHVKAGKHAGTVYNFKRKSRIRKSLTRLPILLEFIHKYIFLNFVSFYNGLNSNIQFSLFVYLTAVSAYASSAGTLFTVSSPCTRTSAEIPSTVTEPSAVPRDLHPAFLPLTQISHVPAGKFTVTASGFPL